MPTLNTRNKGPVALETANRDAASQQTSTAQYLRTLVVAMARANDASGDLLLLKDLTAGKNSRVYHSNVDGALVLAPANGLVRVDGLAGLTSAAPGLIPLLQVNWTQSQADPTFGTTAGIGSFVTFNPAAGSVNHMAALVSQITVDGAYGAAAPNWTVGQQIAGRFYSKTAATRTADTQRLVGVSATASHMAPNVIASYVHAYDGYASALAGSVTNLTVYDTNQSVGNNAIVGTARLAWLTPPNFFSGGTAGVTVGLEIDPWPGGYFNQSATPWTAGAWGNAYAIRAAAGHVSLMGPLSVGTATLPPVNQLAQFVSTTPMTSPLIQVTWTQTQPDPTAAAPGISAAINAVTTFNPGAGGVANNMSGFFAELIGDGTQNLGTLSAVYGDAETPSGTTRTGTLLRLVGGKFNASKRDSSAGVATFVEGVFASASALNGGSVTNLSCFNISSSVTGTAAVNTWRAFWMAKPFVAGTASVGTIVGLDIEDYSTLVGAQYGTVYALRVNGGLSSFGGDIQFTTSTHGVVYKSPNGTLYRVSVADNGTLITTAI